MTVFIVNVDRIGLGFGFSSMFTDSLRAALDDDEITFSYSNDGFSMTKIYVIYETSTWSIGSKDKFEMAYYISGGTFYNPFDINHQLELF